MSRPMLVMQRTLLSELHSKRAIRVPLTSLIEQHKLDITHPTLSKMLQHYDALIRITHKETAELISASLFPEWMNSKDKIQTQPSDWYYTGHFPMGKWVKRNA